MAIIMGDLRQLTQISVDKENVFKQIEKTLEKTKLDNQKKLLQKVREVEKLINENRKFLRLLANEVITQDAYKDITSLNQNKIHELGLEIIKLKSDSNDGTMDNSQLQKFYNIAESILAFEDLNEELLHRLVERIEVKVDSEVVIHYKFINPLSMVG